VDWVCINPFGGDVGIGTNDAFIYIRIPANAATNYGAAIVFENTSGAAGGRLSLGRIAALRENNAGNYSSYLQFDLSQPRRAPRIGGAVALFSNLGAFTGVVDPRGGFAFPSASPASIASSSASSRSLTGGAITLATIRTRA